MHAPILALLLSVAPVRAQDLPGDAMQGNAVQGDAGACAQPTSTADVQASLEVAEAAYTDADLTALEQATLQAQAQLPCVHETVSRSLAARFHRTMGLWSFVEQQEERAERSFAAARSIEPDYTFPAEVVPPGNPVLHHYRALSVEHPLRLPLSPVPAEGRLLLDGRPATSRATSWPVIVQVLNPSGAVQSTAWVWPDAPMPAYPPAPPPSVDLAAVPSPVLPPRPWLRRKAPWLAGAAVGLATSATLFGLSRSAASTFDDPTTTGQDRLSHLRSQANGLLYGSAGTAALTVGVSAVGLAF